MAKKEALIMLRVDTETKKRIQDAARRRGQSVSALMLDAAQRQVERVERSTPKPVHEVFRALCLTATAGGRDGYGSAGYEMTRHIAELSPDDLDDDKWRGRLEALSTLLKSDDDEEMVAWFNLSLPRCMALVPARRMGTFIAGVRRYVEDHGADW